MLAKAAAEQGSPREFKNMPKPAEKKISAYDVAGCWCNTLMPNIVPGLCGSIGWMSAVDEDTYTARGCCIHGSPFFPIIETRKRVGESNYFYLKAPIMDTNNRVFFAKKGFFFWACWWGVVCCQPGRPKDKEPPTTGPTPTPSSTEMVRV